MIYTGRYSEHEELDLNPEKPFIKDIKKDIAAIDLHYSKKISKEIKLKIINELLQSI
tara:strand:- start:311 stop:481 length:171 start_codon:yes stop_codon:yes gene_type:complete